MELIKKNIYMNRQKGKTVTQTTLDDDVNVPDSKPDMERILLSKAVIKLEDVRPVGDRIILKGQMPFEILYAAAGQGKPENLKGELPFEEMVNMEGLEDRDKLQAQWEIEDLSIEMVHSRKLSVKAIISFKLSAESIYRAETAVEARDNEPFETLEKTLEVTQIAAQTRDTYRIKEEIELPGSKPNIHQVLWQHLELHGTDLRPMDGALNIRGELLCFCIYKGEEEHIPLQWMEKTFSFSGNVDMADCSEGMIPAVNVRLAHGDITAAPDYDGETRVLAVDGVLELEIKLYEETSVSILSDVYAPTRDLLPKFDEAFFESLLLKNNSKYKLNDRLMLKGQDKVLQICHCNGSVKLDDVQVVENGISLEGALGITVLYISSDDTMPLNSVSGILPFSHTVEVAGMAPDYEFQVKPGLEQLNAMMLNGDEIEMKAVLTFDTLVLKKITEQVITEVSVTPLDTKQLEEMPGIVGYIVQSGDSLWSIAKRFFTTVQSLKIMNGLTSDEIRPGDRLLIIKQVEEML